MKLRLLAIFMLFGIIIIGAPKIEKGYLDLTNWNFEETGNIGLEGEWKFFWKRFVEIQDIDKAKGYEYIKVPGSWNLTNDKYPSEGYATYYCRLKVDKNVKQLAIKLEAINNAYEMYINGKFVSSGGEISTTVDNARFQYSPGVYFFTNEKEYIDIVIYNSCYDHIRSGLVYPITLGTSKEIVRRSFISIVFDIFTFGSIFIMIFYHIGIYFLRKKDRSTLYFALFCFMIAFRIIILNERVLYIIFPKLNTEIMVRFEYLAYYLAVPLLFLFLNSLFRKYINKTFLKIYVSIGFSIALYCVFVEMMGIYLTLKYYHLYTIIGGFYGVYIFIKSIFDKNKLGYLNLVGFSVLFIAAVNDILRVSELSTFPNISHIGLFIFILNQSLVLALRFTSALRLSEKLVDDNKKMYREIKDFNEKLEERIEGRTQELTGALIQLKQTQNQLIQSEKLASIAKLAGGIAHELNSPLTSIKANCQIGKMDIEDEEIEENIDELADCFREIDTAADRMKDIILKLLKFTNQGEVIMEKINLKEVLLDLSHEYGNIASMKEIDFRVDLPLYLPIIGNKQELFQSFKNIVMNSMESLDNIQKEERFIEIKARNTDEQTVIVEIIDNGSGISEEIIKNIFEPFFTTKTVNKSLGLGLTFAYEVLNKHKALVNVESVSDERTVFKIEFPKAPQLNL